MASGIGMGVGAGIADSFKIDPQYERAALAQEANANKAAAKSQQEGDAAMKFLTENSDLKGVHPAIYDETNQAMKDNLHQAYLAMQSHPNNPGGASLPYVQAAKDIHDRALAQSKNLYDVTNKITDITNDQYRQDPENIALLKGINAANSSKDLPQPTETSSWTVNNGKYALNPLSTGTLDKNLQGYMQSKGVGKNFTGLTNQNGENIIVDAEGVPSSKQLPDLQKRFAANGVPQETIDNIKSGDVLGYEHIQDSPDALDKAKIAVKSNQTLANKYLKDSDGNYLPKSAPTSEAQFPKLLTNGKLVDNPDYVPNQTGEMQRYVIQRADQLSGLKYSTSVQKPAAQKTPTKTTGNAGEKGLVNATPNDATENVVIKDDNGATTVGKSTRSISLTTKDGKTIGGLQTEFDGAAVAGDNPEYKLVNGQYKPYIRISNPNYNAKLGNAIGNNPLIVVPVTKNYYGDFKSKTDNYNTDGGTAAPAAKTATPDDWNTQWSKLKSGETLVGLDGKTYTKK